MQSGAQIDIPKVLGLIPRIYPKTDRPAAERYSPRALQFPPHLEWQQNVSSGLQKSGRDHQCCQGALAFACISLVHQMALKLEELESELRAKLEAMVDNE